MMKLQDPIKNIMTTKVISVLKSTSLAEIKFLFQENNIHHIPVLENEKLVGLVSQLDHPFFFRGYDEKMQITKYDKLTAADIMTKGLAILEPSDKIETALKVFKENLFHSIPVVEGGKLVGIVTTLDIVLGTLEKEAEKETMTLMI